MAKFHKIPNPVLTEDIIENLSSDQYYLQSKLENSNLIILSNSTTIQADASPKNKLGPLVFPSSLENTCQRGNSLV